jgi:hypothetical protein
MRVKHYLVVGVTTLVIGFSNLTFSEELCPAVNCDCSAFSLLPWREKCEQAERPVKEACAANGGVPQYYCGLHGPAAMPTPIELSLNLPDPSAATPTLQAITQNKRQVVMLFWSVKDDLDNIRTREESKFFGDALQVHKLLDQNIDRMFRIQRLAAASEQQLKGDAEAKVIWRDYRDELSDVVAQFEGYGDVLWSKYRASSDPSSKQAYSLLAKRILRSASTLSEQLALAETSAGTASSSALAWQRSARIAKLLLENEIESTNNAQHVAFYRNQCAGRWNRASFYWLEAKDESKTEEAIKAAELVMANIN